MPLPPVYGHADALAMLAAAARAGNLSQSLLVHGPSGIGKERVALWIAQRVLCEQPADDGPCGRCRACRQIDRLEHPDVHWFFPVPRPDASTPEKLRDKLEEARGAELEARRANPHHVPQFDKAPAYFMGTIQNLQRIASVRPSAGSRKVFVVGDADAMVPQESSPEAANAFLKLLEEPPADTTLILTSSNPGALLPTIRSRVLPIRLLRLATEDVTEFLVRELSMDSASAASLAGISEGAIGRALRLSPSAGGAGAALRMREMGRDLLAAALADSEAGRFAAANAVAPSGARGEFTGVLSALALWLRDLMAVAAGAHDSVAFATSADEALLRKFAARPGLRAEGVARAILRVQEAQELAAGNVNPQLILADLLGGIRKALAKGARGWGGPPARAAEAAATTAGSPANCAGLWPTPGIVSAPGRRADTQDCHSEGAPPGSLRITRLGATEESTVGLLVIRRAPRTGGHNPRRRISRFPAANSFAPGSGALLASARSGTLHIICLRSGDDLER